LKSRAISQSTQLASIAANRDWGKAQGCWCRDRNQAAVVGFDSRPWVFWGVDLKSLNVISGSLPWSVDQSDAVAWLQSLPPDSADLIFTSPPYEQARLYLEGGEDLGVSRKTEEWVSWMVEVFRECSRVCRGLVAFVVEGQTKNFRYSAGPALLMADLHRAGFNLRKPAVFHRNGIPGSGGPDWLRNDWEWIICATRPGKLPWSNNTAMGHKPKWAPGGEMSYRLADGSKRNEWGGTGHATGGEGRKRNGEHKTRPRTKGGNPKDSCKGRLVTRGQSNGDTQTEGAYFPPVLANPGNAPEATYTASQVAEMLQEESDWIHCKVGGGQMGHNLAHKNEAPFPESLADFFVLSFCPPGGIVCDPFSGSGTTIASAVKNRRRAIGCDLRASQVDLTNCRVADTQPLLGQSTAVLAPGKCAFCGSPTTLENLQPLCRPCNVQKGAK